MSRKFRATWGVRPNWGPISFKPKVAIVKFIGKMQKKSGFMISGLAVPLFLLYNLLISNYVKIPLPTCYKSTKMSFLNTI